MLNGKPSHWKQADERREKILKVLEDYPRGTNLRILMQRTGITSTSMMRFYVGQLRKAGYIAEPDYERQANSIRLAD